MNHDQSSVTRRADDDLCQALRHVRYEFEMLEDTAMLLGLGMLAGNLHNAVLESFLTHMRNLHDFAYVVNARFPDDVRAGDFFDDATWTENCPKCSDVLKESAARANKMLAHITHTRVLLRQSESQWQHGQLAVELTGIMMTFFRRGRKRSRVANAFLEIPLQTNVQFRGQADSL